jgi:hypothetical protein
VGVKCKILLKFVNIEIEIKMENKSVFRPYHADECLSKLLFKDQSRAFVRVKLEWFGDKIVPKIGLQRTARKSGHRWVESIHRRIDLSLLDYNFYNASLILIM